MTIEERMRRLERSHRRLGVGFAILSVLASALVLFAAAPGGGWPDVVTAGTFRLVHQGRIVGELTGVGDGGTLFLADTTGIKRACLSAGAKLSCLLLGSTEKGDKIPVTLMASPDWSGLECTSAAGKQACLFGLLEGNPVYRLMDAQGNLRIFGGVIKQGASHAIRALDGTVQWQAP